MDKRSKSAEDLLLEDSQALFERRVEEIDAATRTKLRAARERALEELAPRPRFGSAWLWVPAAVAAALVALVILPTVERDATEVEAGFEALAAADLEILLGEEELEMLAELEFYEWLDLQDADEAGSESIDGVG